MKRTFFGCVLIAGAAWAAPQGAVSTETRPCAFTNEAGQVLLYRAHVPEPAPEPAPLVLFLHGAGERGNDNTAQLVHGVKPLLDYFAKRRERVYLLAPQCEPNRRWAEVDWSAPAHVFPRETSPMMTRVLQLLEKTIATENVDPTRVYVAGLSMGGYGTWDILCRRPDLFAAGMPLCGGGDPHQAYRLRDMPILAAHGTEDTAVPTVRSRDMVAALRLLDAPIRYVEYPGCGHNCWSPAFGDAALLDWLFAHRRVTALPRAAYLAPRADETDVWEVAPDALTPAAYLERLRACGAALRRARPNARVVCRRDRTSAAFASALDAFGEGEEYEYRAGPAVRTLTGTLEGPVLFAGSGRAVLLGRDGEERASWTGCGNIHCVYRTATDLWWSNGAVWRRPLAGGEPVCVWRAPNEVGGGVLGFELQPDGAVVMAVNSTREIVELAPPPAFPPQAGYAVRRRFKVDARAAGGKEPGAHGALRLVHKTARGTYLTCCAGAACVREYDAAGKLVWEQAAAPFVFDCLRRANGNTLVSHLDGITEFTPDHRVAWKFACADLPELKLANLCGIRERRNGNLVVGTWNRGSRARTQATVFEITRDKTCVWAYYGADANAMTAARVD